MTEQNDSPVGRTAPVDVLLGLGANLDDPLAQLAEAVRRLRSLMTVDAISDVYVTEPVGGPPQPDFFNLVLRGLTNGTVFAFHEAIHRVEDEMGRTRLEVYGPRAIDIDLLAYGELVFSSSQLVVPHPRMHERSFVLVPLVEVAPEWRHPGLGTTARESLAGMTSPTRVMRHGKLPVDG